MQVMQVDAVERHAKLREGVQRGFLSPPVEAIAPVVCQLAKISDRGAIGPCVTGRLIGKTGTRQTMTEVGDVGIRDAKCEGSGLDRHASCRRCALRRYIALSASS